MARKRVHRKKPHRRMRGSGIFGRIWDGIKRAVTKPSTWLTTAGMLPTPLSLPLKVAGAVTGLAGHGRRKRRHRGRGIGPWGAPLQMRPLPYLRGPYGGVNLGLRGSGRGVPNTDPIA
jgi:hypothetical protein